MRRPELCVSNLSRRDIGLLHQLLHKEHVIEVHLFAREFELREGVRTRTSAVLERVWFGSWVLMMRRIAFLGYVFVMAWSRGPLFTLRGSGAGFGFRNGPLTRWRGNVLD